MKKCFDPKFQRPALSLLTAGGLLCLQACGGGGGGGGIASVIDPGGGGAGGGQGIIGTGLTSSGTIDGAGSVFVNGVRFDIDDAEIAIDGETASEDDLGPGMAVRIKGTVAEDGKSGKATRVDVSTSLEGPVSAIKRNADNSSARLTILGQTVIVERTSTVFEDVRFSALATGMALEVSGYRDPNGRLRATRVEADDDPNEVQLEGVVGALNGLNFRIGSQPVDASAANLGDLSNSALSAGLRVSVEGRLQNGVIVADDIDPADDLSRGLEANAAITLLGSVSGLSGSTFVVEGLSVDISNTNKARLQTGGLPLSNGSIVEVRGVWDGRRVAARSVTRRRGRIEFEGSLASVASATRSLALRVGNDTVSVATDERTLFDDERDDIKFLKLSNLATGDFLRVEALSLGNRLLATRVDREDDDEDEDTVLQAPLQSFVNGLSVTLQGVTFNVTRAEFENVDDKDINASVFFANLKTGALLRVTDKAPADGFAEEVEFEFATTLDGDREFEDDDEERIDPARLPQRVRDYIAANFPGRGIAFAKRDDDEIEVYLTNGTEVSFDLNGRFIETDDDDDDRDDDRDDDSDDSNDDDSDDSNDGDSDDSSDDDSDDSSDDDSDDSSDDGSDDSNDDSSDDSNDDSSDDSNDDGSDDSNDGGSDDSSDDGSDDSNDDGSDNSSDDGSDDSGDDSSDDSNDGGSDDSGGDGSDGSDS